jgi:ABC-type multidrug transport system ATPase subunit
MKMIDVYHISKSFNESFRLDDISFSLEAGEHIFFVGPNGAGKTTLLKLLAGKLLPDEGSIRINGFPIDTHEKEVRELISWIPTRDNGFFSRLTKWSEIPTFKRMLDVRYVDCSSGMRQLLQIFTLTMHLPKVVIMDEPFRSLDPETREQLQSILLEEFKDSTFIMSTHHLGDTEFLAGRVIRIERGKFAH